MAFFKYKGFDLSGKGISGVIEAATKVTALKDLKREKINPYLLEETGKKKRRWFFLKKAPSQLFFQLGIMLKSGLPLTKALEITTKNQEQKEISHILSALKRDISEGKKFSESLGKYPQLFSGVYVNMVRIAEATGGLADVLLNISAYEEKKRESEGKLKSALTYPLVVSLIGSGVVGFLLGYVVPKMEKIFHSVKIDLPFSTKVLIAFGTFLRNYGFLTILFLGMLLVGGYRMYSSSVSIRRYIDSLLFKIKLLQKAVLARFSELLAFQLFQGIPLVTALSGCAGIVKNSIIKEEIGRLASEVEKGKSLSESLKRSSIFDEMLIAAVLTGESTGNLSNFLERMALFYRTDVDRVMNRLTSLAEPILILVLGLVVGFIVVSIMTPLFELNQLVR